MCKYNSSDIKNNMRVRVQKHCVLGLFQDIVSIAGFHFQAQVPAYSCIAAGTLLLLGFRISFDLYLHMAVLHSIS